MKMLMSMSGWKALIAILIVGGISIFAGGIKIVKIVGWVLVAVIAAIAAWNEIR